MPNAELTAAALTLSHTAVVLDPIKIRGREYSVTKVIKDPKEYPTQGDQYILAGKRGALYATMRNMHRPDSLFLYDTRGYAAAMSGVWLTDKDGVLAVVTE